MPLPEKPPALAGEVITLFVFLQRFISGLTAGALKG